MQIFYMVKKKVSNLGILPSLYKTWGGEVLLGTGIKSKDHCRLRPGENSTQSYSKLILIKFWIYYLIKWLNFSGEIYCSCLLS